MKVREIIKLIEKDGWYLVTTKGSHRQFKHPEKPGRVTVPGHVGEDMPEGIRISILNQAGLRKRGK
ncbi:MAG: type II toxin-antitoxin system HicA family toxin [bacterium]|nr:type II toxin-antitoxin system HicA family toxin [bacterium]